MSRQKQQLTIVGVLLLAVLALAIAKPTGFDSAEVIWTGCGAIGSVYAWYAWRRRVDVNEWRKTEQVNGLFAIVAEQHATLRGVGLAIQLLIMLSGLLAMLNAGRLLVIGAIIAIAALSTFGAWYAERKAEQQGRYIRVHPEM